MGRKKKELTEVEQEERKKRYWGEERNRRRRERYAQDPTYRLKAIAQGRQSYRDTAGVSTEDCRVNLPRLTSTATEREVRLANGLVHAIPSISVSEMAELINRNPNVVHRWITKRTGRRRPTP